MSNKDNYRSDEDFEFEDELAKSISDIISEETAGAQAYVKSQGITPKSSKNAETSSSKKSKEATKESKGQLVVVIVIIVLAVVIIGLVAFFVINSVLQRSKESYANYNNLGYTAYESKNYEDAVKYFNKALTFDEGSEVSDININMMLHLYDCYKQLGQTANAIGVLKDILVLDSNNSDVIYTLVKEYEEAKNYEAIRTLYDKYGNSSDSKISGIFTRFIPDAPSASPEGAKYSFDQKVTLTAGDEDASIYYTTNGKDPVESGTLYDDVISVSSGTTIIKFYTVNEYGFISDIVTEEYTVSYEAPDEPVFSPKSGSYTGSKDSVKVTIAGYTGDCTVYYTTDGSTPTQDSEVYTDPIILEAGSTTIKAMAVNEKGLASNIATATYKVVIKAEYTSDKAVELIWQRLMTLNVCDTFHKTKDDELVELHYYSKKVIDDTTIYLFKVVIGGEEQEYYYGTNADNGTTYKITEDGGVYSVKTL